MRKIVVLGTILLMTVAALPALAASEVIIDNTSPSAVFVGTWTTASSATDKYGSDYRYATQNTTGSRTATYTPTLASTASDWQVYVWYPTVTSATTAGQHIVHHSGGDTIVVINQTTNRGMWVQVGGNYTMNAGTGNYLRITSYHASLTSRVIADAARFYSATAGADTTPPVISNVGANPNVLSAVITWTTDEPATSQVEYGTTPAYGSQTTKDTNLVTSHSVNVTGLSQSTLYHYRVKSDDAAGNPAVSGDYTFNTTAPAPEFRSVWINTWNAPSILNATEVTGLVNMTSGANYNVLIPEIRKRADAYYISHQLYCPWCTSQLPPYTPVYHKEPKASNINDPDPNYDPLQDAIDKAHAQGMQVHPWIVTYRAASTTVAQPADHVWTVHGATTTANDYIDWSMRKSDNTYADGTSYNLDPGVPCVQDYLCRVVLDIVTNYDVDGFNYDYIRYPTGYYWGYNDISKARFLADSGLGSVPTSTADANWETWAQWRRQQVTDLIKRCYLEIMAVKPWVNHNVDTVGWSGGDPTNESGYLDTRQYKEVYQDARGWMRDHLIDTNILMNYKREFDVAQAPDYRLWTNAIAAWQTETGRWSVDGQACYLNSISDSVIQMQVGRDAGIGLCNYDYITTNPAPVDRQGFFDAVEANLYQTPVSVPDMTWKTAPTTGILFGTVTDAAKPNHPIYLNWVYKATVTATGPEIRSTQTDATGTYGFLDLTPGTYSIAVSKSGFTSRTYTNQSLSAGQVLRENFALGVKTASSPAGTLNASWGLISVPSPPVNPDPANVFAGIDIDSKLYRFDRATQSMILYDTWTPDVFGNVSVDDGYWLQVDTNKTISYQAYGDTPATYTTQLPAAGWSIIGCPFQSNIQWPNALVTLGATTVPISTARGNGWISGTGYWFDSSTQSMVDFGLPEDFPTGSELYPWHGHWIQSLVNNLSLTLR